MSMFSISSNVAGSEGKAMFAKIPPWRYNYVIVVIKLVTLGLINCQCLSIGVAQTPSFTVFQEVESGSQELVGIYRI